MIEKVRPARRSPAEGTAPERAREGSAPARTGPGELQVYRSNRPERLVGRLVELLEAGPRGASADPLTPELVVVGSQGMERWLVQRIAQRLGVCAGVEFPFPGQLVRRAFAAALGDEVEGLASWTPERLSWSVLRLLPGLLGRPELAPLASYLGDEEPEGVVSRRSLQLARRIADTFDRYATYRPDMVLDWEQGGGDAGDWQPLLWRELASTVGAPHLASLVRRFSARLAEPHVELAGLPARLFVFGVSMLPPFHVGILGDLARHLEVHLFVPSPAQGYWAEMRTEREADRLERPAGRDRAALHVERLPPLLDAFGRLYRDFQGVLLDTVAYGEPDDDGLFEAPERDTMLHALQRDVLELVTRGGPGGLPRLPVDAAADDSIRVHACHGPMRQVEVLRDELLALFDRDVGLEPRHVVVMTPDPATYAPLVDAAFSDGDGQAGFPRIPFQVADRSLRDVNPAAEALLAALHVASGRLAATEVLDLLALDVVRERFAIGALDLPRLREWVAASGVAWGLDDEHRAALDQPRTLEATWRFGLDRLLVGLAMRGRGRELFEGVLPYDEVEGTATELLGRFADFVERLLALVHELKAPRPLPAWRDLLFRVLDDLIDAAGDRAADAQRVRNELGALVEEAVAAAPDARLDLAALLSLLEGRFETSAGGGFLDGRLTLCGMVPMRTIPFEVVCLLGMDDDVFPRARVRASFDKVEAARRRGDRTSRDDDRSIFLEALLAARDRLIVTFTGRSVTTNEPVAPAVPVGELLDAIDATFDCGEGREARELVTVEHPLQPFSPCCFGVDAAGRPAPPASFDRRALAGAERLRATWRGRAGDDQPGPRPLFDGPLPALAPVAPERSIGVGLHDLARFLRSPVEWILSRRVGVRLEVEGEELRDREPVELDGLRRHALGTSLLEWEVSSARPADPEVVMRGGARLPVGAPGRYVLRQVERTAGAIARRVEALPLGSPLEPIDVDLELEPVRLRGRLTGLRDVGLVVSQFGKVRPDQRLALWVQHLALMIAGPRPAGPSRIVGQGEGGGVEVMVIPALDAGRAREHLAALLRVFLAGQRTPLMFFPDTSLAYALEYLSRAAGPEAAPDEADARRLARSAAAQAWIRTTGTSEWGDGTSPWVRRVLGEPAPCPAEEGFAIPGLEGAAAPTFHELALALWQPLIELGATGEPR